MKIKRRVLVSTLSLVCPGLAEKEIIEQTTSFVFKDGYVFTFNDEIACRVPLKTKMECAVPSAPLLNLLGSIPDEELDLSVQEGQLCIAAKKKTAKIKIEKEIHLPFDIVDKPKKWKKLNKDILSAIEKVASCTGRNETEFALTCVCLLPECIQATDGSQVAMCEVATPVKDRLLLRYNVVPHIIRTAPTSISETKNWVHFEGEDGLLLSCRKHIENHPNCSSYFSKKGKKTTLPEDLISICQRAEIFSKDTKNENELMVSLSDNKATIEGIGDVGSYKETAKTKYTGKDIKFKISPSILASLSKKHNECLVSETKLTVHDGNFHYTTALGAEDAE